MLPRRRLVGRLSTVLVLLGASLLAGLGSWYVVVPYPWTLASRDPVRTSLMEQRMREARRGGGELEIRQDWVGLEEISPALRRAVVVAEDYRFREHQGIDWVSLADEIQWSGDDDFSWWSSSDRRALSEAIGYAWAHRSDMRGRSTITQQVAKNLYFGTDRSFVRKAMEFVVARRLERRLDKDRILELYLNIAEWGPGVFGAEAAARTYFGKAAGALTLAEAAALAGTLRTRSPRIRQPTPVACAGDRSSSWNGSTRRAGSRPLPGRFPTSRSNSSCRSSRRSSRQSRASSFRRRSSRSTASPRRSIRCRRMPTGLIATRPSFA